MPEQTRAPVQLLICSGRNNITDLNLLRSQFVTIAISLPCHNTSSSHLSVYAVTLLHVFFTASVIRERHRSLHGNEGRWNLIAIIIRVYSLLQDMTFALHVIRRYICTSPSGNSMKYSSGCGRTSPG